MRLYIDTNVIIDILANRTKFCNDAKKIIELAINQKAAIYISSSAFTDIHYCIKRIYHDENMTRSQMSKLLYFFTILEVNQYDCKVAFDSQINDYEDALIEQVAYRNKLDYIITRNTLDYKNSRISIMSPHEFLLKYDK